MNGNIYSFSLTDIDGKNVDMISFKEKVLLIVNVASKCGFTKQYEELELLYKKYQDKDFIVLGIPCNQFNNQEPGNEEEIKKFCTLNYNITFPLFAKIEVNGDNEHPLYTYLKQSKKGFLGTSAIKWNFTKFLVNRSGEVIKRYAPVVAPLSIAADIERFL